MLHRERMLAMEKGIPLPELPNPEENSSDSLLDQLPIPRKDALVKLTLGCGMLLFFLGFGIIVAFMLAPHEAHLHQAWTVGFIPLLVGCGFLLYSLLIRRSHS